MATATISTPAPSPEMARLRAEMDKRGINRRRIALRISYLKHSPDRIYKILDGSRPAPDDFLDTVCGLTGIPLKAVLSPDDYRARRDALRYEMTTEDIEGRDWKGY